MSDENHFTVYVWKKDDEKNSLGHVADRTYTDGPFGVGNYMSFWPDHGILPPALNNIHIFTGGSVRGRFVEDQFVGGEFKKGYELDTEAMGREADWVFEFYSFPFMNKPYEQLKESALQWSLVNDSNYRSDTHSCASFIVSMMKACRGSTIGWEEIFSPESLDDIVTSTLRGHGKVITPNGVANLCEKLIEKERLSYHHIPDDNHALPICFAYNRMLEQEDGAVFIPCRGKPAPLMGEGKLTKPGCHIC